MGFVHGVGVPIGSVSYSCGPLRTFARQRRAGDEVEHRFGDVGGVVADPLDVLRAEQQVGAERDVARIFHHVGQEVAEDGILERVEFGVALPYRPRALGVALGVGVEHVLHQFGGDVVHVTGRPTIARGTRASMPISAIAWRCSWPGRQPARGRRRPGSRRRSRAVDRHRLTPSDGANRLLLDLALQRVEARVGGDDLVGQRGVPWLSASIASITIFSAMPPISAIRRSRASRSLSYDLTM